MTFSVVMSTGVCVKDRSENPAAQRGVAADSLARSFAKGNAQKETNDPQVAALIPALNV